MIYRIGHSCFQVIKPSSHRLKLEWNSLAEITENLMGRPGLAYYLLIIASGLVSLLDHWVGFSHTQAPDIYCISLAGSVERERIFPDCSSKSLRVDYNWPSMADTVISLANSASRPQP